MLIVFDLDFTLWDCGGLWIDCTTPPFRMDATGQVCDAEERTFRLYPDALEILESIKDAGIAIASRTSQPTWAREVLRLMDVHHFFQYEAIYPGSKVAHFEQLRAETGLPYSEMLFFDDEPRNLIEVGALGVTAIEVPNGINWSIYENGIHQLNGKNDQTGSGHRSDPI